MLDSLHIKNFRCFEDLQIESLGRVNLIVGKNNVGKSTLLEAISALANNGSDTVLNKILKSRHETFSHHKLFEKVKNSNSVEEVYIGDDNRFISTPNDRYSPFSDTQNNRHAFKKRCGTTPISIVKTQLESESSLARSWDNAYLNSDEKTIIDTLQILNKEITNLVFIQSQYQNDQTNEPERIAIIKIHEQAEATPLKSMGEGNSRLLNIFLKATQAQDGFLTIDEFENGLHYSIQEEVWEKLFKLAEKLNIQVFATTHSMDTIRSFSKVAIANKETEGKLISLGRYAGKTNRGKIISHVYDEEELSWIVNSGMEIR